MKALRIAMIVIGILGIADTAVFSIWSNLNLGIILPAILGTPLLIAGIFFGRLRAFTESIPWLRYVFFGAYAAVFLFMIIIGGMIFTSAHEEPEDGADALIVLGCAVHGNRVSLTLSYRLDRAIEYLNENPNTIAIVSGGKGQGESVSEAEAMHKYMVQNGIAAERIIEEDKSESTEENFRFSNEIINSLFPNGAKIAFVTTNFHVLRAELVAKKQGIEADGFGAKDVWYTAMNNYMRESIALAYYKLTGKI
jgi:uncharacterized SAM-binding protein YcdF (DUF218 family)